MITVIIATKNGEKYIRRALESVILQEEVDFDIRVVLDGCTDNTLSIVQDFAQEHPLVEMYTVDLAENIGPGLARNLAILGGKAITKNGTIDIPEARGQYISIIDDDDIWDNSLKLKKQQDTLSENPDIAVVGSSVVDFIDEDGLLIKAIYQPEKYSDTKNQMLLRNPIINSSVMFKKDIFKEMEGFKNMFLAEDYDLWLRIGRKYQIVNIPDAKIKYTVRKNSASNAKKYTMAMTILRLIKENGRFYPNYTKSLIKGYLRLLKSIF
jgi:glycosyltransferase involved in cell wall biosynthesis